MNTRHVLLLCSLLLSLPLAAAPQWQDKPLPVLSGDSWQLELLARGLDDGWGLAQLPDGRWLASSRKGGELWLLDQQKASLKTVLQIDNHYRRGQGGLFALHVDRDFARHPYVYLAMAVSEQGKTSTRLLRYRWQDDHLQHEQTLFTASPWVDNSGHFGGAIAQDDQGHLYLSVGDRRQPALPQQPGNSVGSIVRLDRDGRPAAGNPFAGQGDAAVYSYGHRNPQGLDWADGVLWAVEHGPQGGDELNRIEAGRNYGWPVITYGEQYGGGRIGEGTARAGMEQPLYYYVPSIATSDLLVYRSQALPGWQGSILVGSLRAGVVSRLVQVDGQWQERERLFGSLGERWRSLAVDGQGQVWLLAESGRLYRLRPR